MDALAEVNIHVRSRIEDTLAAVETIKFLVRFPQGGGSDLTFSLPRRSIGGLSLNVQVGSRDALPGPKCTDRECDGEAERWVLECIDGIVHGV